MGERRRALLMQRQVTAALPHLFFLLLTIARVVTTLDNGAGEVPAMGWNSWNTFRCDINEAVVKAVADSIVSSGLRDAGYVYVNIDDCWMTGERDATTRRLVPSPDKFPSGLAALAAYLHQRRLKFGIYSSAGKKTCEGLPASYGYEEEDAMSFAEWGVDYLKYDFCGMEGLSESAETVYGRMRDALAMASAATGRPILYSLCSWGNGRPHRWGASVGNSWRTGRDLFAVWDRAAAASLGLPGYLQSVMEAVDGQRGLARFAGPGGFNDPDMLTVGLHGMYPYGIVERCPPAVPDCTPGEYITRERWGKVGGLTQTEQVAHFSLWAILAAPLLLGNDPRAMSTQTLEILLAPEVIAVNQDPAGLQGRVTGSTRAGNGEVETEIWSKRLADGSFALLLLNRGDVTINMRAEWARDVADSTRHRGSSDECEKETEECEGWAASGECERNSGFMLVSCSCSCADVMQQHQPSGRSGVFGSEIEGGGVDSSSSRADNRPVVFARVRDVWARRDLGRHEGGFTAVDVPSHGVRLFRVIITASTDTESAYNAETKDNGWLHFAPAQPDAMNAIVPSKSTASTTSSSRGEHGDVRSDIGSGNIYRDRLVENPRDGRDVGCRGRSSVSCGWCVVVLVIENACIVVWLMRRALVRRLVPKPEHMHL